MKEFKKYQWDYVICTHNDLKIISKVKESNMVSYTM